MASKTIKTVLIVLILCVTAQAQDMVPPDTLIWPDSTGTDTLIFHIGWLPNGFEISQEWITHDSVVFHQVIQATKDSVSGLKLEPIIMIMRPPVYDPYDVDRDGDVDMTDLISLFWRVLW